MGQHKLMIDGNFRSLRVQLRRIRLHPQFEPLVAIEYAVPASASDCQSICSALCEQPPSDASAVGVHIRDRLHQAGDAGNQGCLCRMEIGVGTLHPSSQCCLIACHDGVEVAIKAHQQGSQFPPLSRTDDLYLILKFKWFSEKTPDLFIFPRILLSMNVDAPSTRHPLSPWGPHGSTLRHLCLRRCPPWRMSCIASTWAPFVSCQNKCAAVWVRASCDSRFPRNGQERLATFRIKKAQKDEGECR